MRPRLLRRPDRRNPGGLPALRLPPHRPGQPVSLAAHTATPTHDLSFSLLSFSPGSLRPARAWETAATSARRASPDTLASTANGRFDSSGSHVLRFVVDLIVMVPSVPSFSCVPGYVGNPQERVKCRPYDGEKMNVKSLRSYPVRSQQILIHPGSSYPVRSLQLD